MGLAPARDPAPIAQRLRDRLADDIAGVLGGVMKIDVKIALRIQLQVDQAVPRQLLQHVVKKSDPGRHLIGAAAVEIDGTADLRFLGHAFDARLPRRWDDGGRGSSLGHGALLDGEMPQSGPKVLARTAGASQGRRELKKSLGSSGSITDGIRRVQ